MPGLIDQLAAETEDRRQREAEADAASEARKAAEDEKRRRIRHREARRQAMKAARQMTGRVIFPARWSAMDSGHGTVICTERIEGAVEVNVDIAVTVYSINEVKVETRAVVVRAVGGEDLASWKNPGGPLSRGERPSADSPGREWFRRQLVDLGVI